MVEQVPRPVSKTLFVISIRQALGGPSNSVGYALDAPRAAASDGICYSQPLKLNPRRKKIERIIHPRRLSSCCRCPCSVARSTFGSNSCSSDEFRKECSTWLVHTLNRCSATQRLCGDSAEGLNRCHPGQNGINPLPMLMPESCQAALARLVCGLLRPSAYYLRMPPPGGPPQFGAVDGAGGVAAGVTGMNSSESK